MSDFTIQYEKPRTKDFWCEQDCKWSPNCECKEQCHECALIQGRIEDEYEYNRHYEEELHQRLNECYRYTDDGFCDGFTIN